MTVFKFLTVVFATSATLTLSYYSVGALAIMAGFTPDIASQLALICSLISSGLVFKSGRRWIACSVPTST